MSNNLSLLSNEELKSLFLSESQLFSDGVGNLPFDDLKQMRLKLRDIAIEIKARKLPLDSGLDGDGNGK
jgi:hypothetical protein